MIYRALAFDEVIRSARLLSLTAPGFFSGPMRILIGVAACCKARGGGEEETVGWGSNVRRMALIRAGN